MSVGSVIASVASAPRSGAAAGASVDGGSEFAQTMMLAGEAAPESVGARPDSGSGGRDENPDDTSEPTPADVPAAATAVTPTELVFASSVLGTGSAALLGGAAVSGSAVSGALLSGAAVSGTAVSGVAGPVATGPATLAQTAVPAGGEPAPGAAAAVPALSDPAPSGPAASAAALSPEGTGAASTGPASPFGAAPTGAASAAAPGGPAVATAVPGLQTPALATAGGPQASTPAAPAPTAAAIPTAAEDGPPPLPAPAGTTTVGGTPPGALSAATTQAAAAAVAAVPGAARATSIPASGTTAATPALVDGATDATTGTLPDAELVGTPAVPGASATTTASQAAAATQNAGAGALEGATAARVPGATASGSGMQPSSTVTAKLGSVDVTTSPAGSADGADAPVPGGAGTLPIVTEGRQPALAATDPTVRPQSNAVPMREQVGKPLLALAAAGNGDHTVTISVTPDALGPVTVRAHISDGQVRLELFAPTDPGRDSLRQLLPDLRRDLASTDMGATLDLSSQSGPPSEESRQDDAPLLARPTNEMPASRRQSEAGERIGSRTTDSQLALDVLA